MPPTNGLHIEGGALCAACRSPRPFDELLAFVPVDETWSSGRVRYVCRPSVSDMRLPLCTSRVLLSAAKHKIALAADVARQRRGELDRRATETRPAIPDHVRDYVHSQAVA